MLITQIALIVSQVYVCVQIHQNARIKHVQFLIYQLYPNKADMRRYRFLELEKLHFLRTLISTFLHHTILFHQKFIRTSPEKSTCVELTGAGGGRV